MNQLQTLGKIADTMHDAIGGKATCLRQEKLKNGDYVEQWLCGAETVVFIVFKDGGCMHYVQGQGTGWDVMETQLHQIAAKIA